MAACHGLRLIRSLDPRISACFGADDSSNCNARTKLRTREWLTRSMIAVEAPGPEPFEGRYSGRFTFGCSL